MADTTPSTKQAAETPTRGRPHALFEQQRAALVDEIATNLESVLQNMNRLNRGLEGISAVGNEFGQVEGLWSQFENVMARDDPVAESEVRQGEESREQEA